ncbi:MAG: transposase [Prevotella sp.]|nr:transposase [Prevotella sp.]
MPGVVRSTSRYKLLHAIVQKKRAKILFELYPKLEEAYNLVNSLRTIFRNKKLTKETAKEKFEEWYGESCCMHPT